jgi:hypothetical protein
MQSVMHWGRDRGGLGGGSDARSFYSLTPSCLRMDVVVEPVSTLPSTAFRRRVVVVDRDGLDALVPALADPGPDPKVIAFLVEEFLRQAVNFPAVIHRNDPLSGVVAITGQRQMLYDPLR